MSQLTAELTPDVVAACQAGAEETAGALSRALGGEITLSVGEPGQFDPATPPKGAAGPGLLVKLTVGDAALAAVLPASAGLTPDWCPAPDPTGESKLATLAQELGMLVLPESLPAADFDARWVDDLAAALEKGGVAAGAALLPLTLASGDKRGDLTLLWPATDPAGLLATDEAAPDAAAQAAPAVGSSVGAPPPPGVLVTDFRDLPPYARSLLQVMVPVTVTLATKREQVSRVVDLGPGSILTFDKPCDGPLTVEVGDQEIASGEAVKVGEKFGVRIREMTLPGERFKRVRPPRAG